MPRTPFASRKIAPDSVPGTPITPYTAFGERRTSLGGPVFYVANENSKLPLLDETDDNLASFYNNLLRFVEKNCRTIMDVTAKIGARHGKKYMPAPEAVGDTILDVPDEGEHLAVSSHFEIMANVIWAEIGQALMDELGTVIFSAGRPAEFKKVGISVLVASSLIVFLALCNHTSVHGSA
jgi:conserved oligomeric Golgi complex subunit 2